MNAFNIRRWFGDPTPLEQASAELEDARRDLLHAASARELYAAHEEMLEGRIARLAAAVYSLSAVDEDRPKPISAIRQGAQP